MDLGQLKLDKLRNLIAGTHHPASHRGSGLIVVAHIKDLAHHRLPARMLAAKRPRAHTDHRPGPARITHQLARLPEPTRTPRPRDALRDPLTVNNPTIINDAALGLGAFRDPSGINDPAIGVPAAGLGCALESVLPVNNPAIGVPAAVGLGCALESAPPDQGSNRHRRLRLLQRPRPRAAPPHARRQAGTARRPQPKHTPPPPPRRDTASRAPQAPQQPSNATSHPGPPTDRQCRRLKDGALFVGALSNI